MFIDKKILFFLIFLYLTGAFLHLGRMYFQHEEPRRAIIALEMNYTHDYIKPTVLGKPYFKKPPLHNIIIALFFKIFGTNEFSARLVSILSMLAIGITIYFTLKNIVGTDASIFATFSFLTAFSTYFSYGILAETDMLFSLFVFLSIISLFWLKKKGILLGSIFTALSLLTKGFPALHYFYFTLIAYAILKKDIKGYLLSKETVLGFFIIAGSFAGWILLASGTNIHSINYALGFLLSESSSRVLSIEKITQVFKHIILFPIEFWYHFLPFSILFLLFFKKEFKNEFLSLIKDNPKIKELFMFSIVAFVPNFLLYALLPGGRVRYTLVLFAFAAFFIGIIYHILEYTEIENINIKKTGTVLICTVILISIFGGIFDFEFTKTSDYIICVLVALTAVATLFISKTIESKTITFFFIITSFTIMLKILYISIYYNYLFNYYTDYRHFGNKIAEFILKENPKYVMTDAVNLRMLFYVEKNLHMQIHPIDTKKEGVILSKRKRVEQKADYSIDTPKGEYYIIKNIGGV